LPWHMSGSATMYSPISIRPCLPFFIVLIIVSALGNDKRGNFCFKFFTKKPMLPR
jgi:hypothetical protein